MYKTEHRQSKIFRSVYLSVSILMVLVLIFTAYGCDKRAPERVIDTTANVFTVDTSELGDEVSNIVSTINLWSMGESFYNPYVNEEYNVYDFVDYVQFMQCSGGNESRDLFLDPYDTTVLDDYDFSSLIKNCRGVLEVGAKPFLKLGSVPMKYSSNYKNGYFKINMYPPDDYDVYYDYIYALASALVEEFGKEEVLKWRFGVMTEYENDEWFVAESLKPAESMEAYFKVYDYTVQALIDAIGEDVFVGAHSMTCTEGAWDEAEFIKHVAQGTNYANGGVGTKISYLSASYYYARPGAMGNRKTLPQTIEYLRSNAEKYGLNDLLYGIDEGRILEGETHGANNSYTLNFRICGYTYQAAFDARLWKQSIDNGLDYFSSWAWLTGGTKGYPTVAYHVADNIYKFAGLKKAAVTNENNANKLAEVDATAVYDEATKTTRIMAYNIQDDLDYDETAKLSFYVKLPEDSGKVKITKKFINDDCNFFDEWIKDRETYDILDEYVTGSPEDPMLDATIIDEDTRSLYWNELRDKYIEESKLTPVVEEQAFEFGAVTIEDTIDPNSVVFYEIEIIKD